MSRFILIALVVSVHPVIASETYIEVGAGRNTNITAASIPWDDGGGTGAYFALRNEWEIGVFIQWSHYSQYEVGAPYNSESESSLDHIGIGIRWQIR